MSFFILFLLILPITFGSILNTASRGQSKESLLTMSSRTMIWEASKRSIKKRPFFGYGLYAETRRLNKNYDDIFVSKKVIKKGVSNTHGSIFEILLAAGFIGGFIHVSLFFITAYRSTKYIVFSKSTTDNILLLVPIIILIIFFRFSTGSALSGFDIFTLFYFLIISLRLFPWDNFHQIHSNVGC